MNLQGANIFFDDDKPVQDPPAASKLKQNLEGAKKLDKEVTYSSSNPRETYSIYSHHSFRYAKKQSEMYQSRMAVSQHVVPGTFLPRGDTVGECKTEEGKRKQPKPVLDEPEEIIQIPEEKKVSVPAPEVPAPEPQQIKPAFKEEEKEMSPIPAAPLPVEEEAKGTEEAPLPLEAIEEAGTMMKPDAGGEKKESPEDEKSYGSLYHVNSSGRDWIRRTRDTSCRRCRRSPTVSPSTIC